MAIVFEWFFAMTNVVFLICQVCWFDVLHQELRCHLVESIIGLVGLCSDEIPVIVGNTVKALSKVCKFEWSLGQGKSCGVADVTEFKYTTTDSFYVLVVKQRERKFAFFCDILTRVHCTGQGDMSNNSQNDAPIRVTRKGSATINQKTRSERNTIVPTFSYH